MVEAAKWKEAVEAVEAQVVLGAPTWLDLLGEDDEAAAEKGVILPDGVVGEAAVVAETAVVAEMPSGRQAPSRQAREVQPGVHRFGGKDEGDGATATRGEEEARKEARAEAQQGGEGRAE